MIEEKNGNIVDAFLNKEIDVLAHGTNCKNGFKSGLAGEIARRIPEAKTRFHEDYRYAQMLETNQIGSVSIFRCRHAYIANCYTQQDYGYDKRVYLDYIALENCIATIALHASVNNLTVGLPKIGCGLAGGEWKEVRKLIYRYFNFYNANVIIYQF